MTKQVSESKMWEVEVDCYEGYRAEESPRCFRWGPGVHAIEEIVDRWYGPEDAYFKVRTSDGDLYILRQSRDGRWTVESFRRGKAIQPAPQDLS